MSNKIHFVRIGITYEDTTPESRERGGFSDTGWEREKEEVTVEEAVEVLGDFPVVHNNGDGTYYGESKTVDYSTGRTRERALHISPADDLSSDRWAKILMGIEALAGITNK